MSLRLPVFIASAMYPLACSMPSSATSSVITVAPIFSACFENQRSGAIAHEAFRSPIQSELGRSSVQV